MGPAPIAWSEIEAFLRLTGTRLAPWEIELVEQLDNIWITVMTDKSWNWTEEEEGDK